MKLKTKKKKGQGGRQVVSVSVPYELRKRMCAVGNVINWSEVAVEAFRQKVEQSELEVSNGNHRD
jgi:hypothetical protein